MAAETNEAVATWAAALAADPVAGIAMRATAAQSALLELAALALRASAPGEVVEPAPALIADAFGAAACSVTVPVGGQRIARTVERRVVTDEPVIVLSAPIVVEGDAAGELVIPDPAPAVATAGTVALVAGVLGDGVHAAKRAETEARHRALAEALAYAAGVYGPADEARARELQHALAAIPGVRRAAVTLADAAGDVEPIADGDDHLAMTVGGDPGLRVAVELDPDVAPRLGTGDAVRQVVIVLAGVVSREDQLAELREEVDTDPLTRVGNRRRALRALRVALSRAERGGDDVTVMLLDLDRFSEVNATRGHPGGDLLLRRFAELLTSETRVYDTVGRLGGDEFVIVLPGTGTAEAARIAERLRERTAAEVDVASPVTVSIGVATYPRHGGDDEALLAAADRALYDAKLAGRDQVAVAASGPSS
jgi:diguanylate cyclase (GGDEF)-like protein